MDQKWYDRIDDKFLVIICATILGGISMFIYPETDSNVIVSSVVSGLFGVAVGKSL
jgi:hypothetical protein